MTKYVMLCHGDARGMGENEGQYLAEFNLEAGHEKIRWSDDIAEAIRFDSFHDFFATWNTVYARIPVRQDGKPNKPLTAWNVEPKPVSDE
jgi:hypothetical protein